MSCVRLFSGPSLLCTINISSQFLNSPEIKFILQFDPWVRKIHWRSNRLPTPVFLGFRGGSAGKESACNTGDLGSIPGLGRSPGEGKGHPLQYSDLEKSMDCIVHGVEKSWTQLSNFHFHFHRQCTSIISQRRKI